MEDTEQKIVPGISMSVLVFASTLLIGGAILVVGCIVSRLSRGKKNGISTKTDTEKLKPVETREPNSGPTGAISGGGSAGSNKRAKNKKRREVQQEFAHTWIVGTLKNHTAPVRDFNFSSNGKFLASCAEDCGLRSQEENLDPGVGDQRKDCIKANGGTSTSTRAITSKSPPVEPTISLDSTKDSSARSTTCHSAKEEQRAILSRRQRKNRTRTPRDQRRESRDEDIEDEVDHRQRRRRVSRNRQVFKNSAREIVEGSQATVLPTSSANTNYRLGKMFHYNVNAQEGYSYLVPLQGSSMNWPFENTDYDIMSTLTAAEIEGMLRNYIISPDDMFAYGYPIASSDTTDCAFIHLHPQRCREFDPTVSTALEGHLDVNAEVFVPRSDSNLRSETVENEAKGQEETAEAVDQGTKSGKAPTEAQEQQVHTGVDGKAQAENERDSGNGSGSSVENSDYSDSENKGTESSSSVSYWTENRNEEDNEGSDWETPGITEKKCSRCSKSFYVYAFSGNYCESEACVYHWGKLRNGRAPHTPSIWDCCNSAEKVPGCTVADLHVWQTALHVGYNGPFSGYVKTRSYGGDMPGDGYGVYALDCEMIYTVRGFDVAKVTVVRMDGTVVYDTLIRPDCRVIDCNTRFSGITMEDMVTATKTLWDVQQDLLTFIYAESILIGHALENDLRVLKMCHANIVDTSVLYPHIKGFPYRNSLKSLAKFILYRDIQQQEHCSIEDAMTVMEVMLRRVKLDFEATLRQMGKYGVCYNV